MQVTNHLANPETSQRRDSGSFLCAEAVMWRHSQFTPSPITKQANQVCHDPDGALLMDGSGEEALEGRLNLLHLPTALQSASRLGICLTP